jgi:hypothetical protein
LQKKEKMNYLEKYQKAFNKLKEIESDFEEGEFYDLIDEIKSDTQYLFEQAEKHPKYRFVPTKEVPASVELEKLENLIKEIKIS